MSKIQTKNQQKCFDFCSKVTAIKIQKLLASNFWSCSRHKIRMIKLQSMKKIKRWLEKWSTQATSKFLFQHRMAKSVLILTRWLVFWLCKPAFCLFECFLLKYKHFYFTIICIIYISNLGLYNKKTDAYMSKNRIYLRIFFYFGALW